MRFIWPQSLYRQLMLAVALGLLLVQGSGAFIRYYADQNMAIAQAALVLRERIGNQADRVAEQGIEWSSLKQSEKRQRSSGFAIMVTKDPISIAGFNAEADLSQAAYQQLAADGLSPVYVSSGPIAALPEPLSKAQMQSRFVRRLRAKNQALPTEAIFLTARTEDGDWISSAVAVRPQGRWFLAALIVRTLLLFAAVMIPIALICRRIVRPLERLTERVSKVGLEGGTAPLRSEGPIDVRNVIDSFNTMQSRVEALLGEKDVMLGAIGHDLKTPLAALRVRIESVEDDEEREKMAASVDEMVVILDDILVLARLGKSGEAMQRTDVGALVESVIDEFSGVGSEVSYEPPSTRLVANIRPVLIRRALRNVIGNALKHGGNATVTLSENAGSVLIYIDDTGPGIPQEQMEDMFAPFMRAEASRNRATGGSGLGLTISRAIARSHNGDVMLANRNEGGLRATIILPV
jgi:signal transduction histidine kinase